MSELEILRKAIEAEKVSLITYLGFARKTKDQSGKNMFIGPAIDEFSHMRMLEEQTSSLSEKGVWKRMAIERSELEELVPKLKDKAAKTKGMAGVDEVDALKTTLELEERAAKYYRHQTHQVEDDSAREMFKRLAEMEDAHYELIQAQLDYILGTGYWFGTREFTQE